MPNYLYIAGPTEGPVKIGFSASPKSRIAQLRNSSPADLKMVRCYEVVDPAKTKLIEQTVHLVLQGNRMNGEWFNVTANQAVDAIAKTSKATGIRLTPSTDIIEGCQPSDRTPLGRPKTGNAKKAVTIRLDQDLVAALEAYGPEWRLFANDALRKALGLSDR